ncbi:MAG: hypothetical protein IMZ64_04345 [Bacteroidetes bacterium]|nr:hypothetical protein [Bacteroidota bacterium]
MSTIHIKAKNKGKFNALKKRTGKSTAELKHSKNPLTRKRATFAANSKKWHHEEGGYINPEEFGFGGVLQGIAPFLSLIPGVGVPLSMGAAAVGGMMKSDEANKDAANQENEQRRLMAYDKAQAGQAGITSKYLPTFGMGGDVMGEGNQTPVELEKQETFQTPDGQVGQVDGPSHAQGGVDMSLPAGTFVWSDKLKVPKGVGGMNNLAGQTFAEASAKLLKMKAKYEKMLNK